jgi:hypothetical protein
MASSSRQSSKEERVEQELFSPVMTPQRRSPKRTAVQQQQKQIIREEIVHVSDKYAHRQHEQQKSNPYCKVEDSKAEKFAKTKVSSRLINLIS